MLRRYGTFTGGIDLPDLKESTLDAPVRRCPRPKLLRVPLAPCGGPPAESVVEPGRRVAAGERIAVRPGAHDSAATPHGEAVDIFAPCAGTVVGPVRVATAGRYGPAHSDAIELNDLDNLPELPHAEPSEEWLHLGPAVLRERIAEGQLTTFRRGAEPLIAWIERSRRKRCPVLIVNVMEHQPYVTADHALLVARGVAVVRGLELLARAAGAEEVFLVVDRRRTEDYRHTESPAREFGIRPVALEPKYPTGADAMLVKVLTRRETPPGAETMDVGSAVVDAATCFAAYAWVACGARPAGRVVTVSGERAENHGNYFVPFGAGCIELVGTGRPPVLHGGPMVGIRCGEEMVVGPATDAVLAPDAPDAPHPGPCIRCGWCIQHCPARLNVATLNDAFELADADRAERMGVRGCIECGVCSYICPARLPLTQRMKQLKRVVGRALAGSKADAD